MPTTTVKITTLEQLKIALQAAKAYVDGEIAGLGTLAGKSEVAYDDLAVALKNLIDGKADGAAVTTLIGTDTGKSARAISAEEVAKVVAGAPTSYDTLKEIAAWITNDTTGAAKMANDISRLDAILKGIGGPDEEATVIAYVQKMINDMGIGGYVTTQMFNDGMAKKVDKVAGSRLMTDAEGTKLGGVSEGANKVEKSATNGNIKIDGTETPVYAHPTSTPAPAAFVKVGNDAAGHVVVGAPITKEDITNLGIPAQDTTYKEATTTTAGLMSATDKEKMDKFTFATDLEVTNICNGVFNPSPAA